MYLTISSCAPAKDLSLPTSTPLVIFSPTASERIEFSMLSPDGSTIIQTKNWVTFEILETKTKKKLWSFSYDRKKFGTGNELEEGGYSPFYWSKDGKYIYVFARQGWDGGNRYYGDQFGAEEGVARFNTENGIMEEVLPEIYGGGYTFALSPDETGIIYTDERDFPLILKWRNLDNQSEKTIWEFDETVFDVGAFGWSPEMDRLTFITLEVRNPFENQEHIFDVFITDLQSPQPQLIIDNFTEHLSFEFWDKQDKIFFMGNSDVIYQVDLNAEVINPVGTATPNP